MPRVEPAGKLVQVNHDDDDGNSTLDLEEPPPWLIPYEGDTVAAVLEIAPGQGVAYNESLTYEIAFDDAVLRVWRLPIGGVGGEEMAPGSDYEHFVWLLGDMNADGAFDNGDIDAFVLALLDPGAFQSTYWDAAYPPYHAIGDFNGDGWTDNGDIEGFTAALVDPVTIWAPVYLRVEAIDYLPALAAATITTDADTDDDSVLDAQDSAPARPYPRYCTALDPCGTQGGLRGCEATYPPGSPWISTHVPWGDTTEYNDCVFLPWDCPVCLCHLEQTGLACGEGAWLGWFLNGQRVGLGQSYYEMAFPDAFQPAIDCWIEEFTGSEYECDLPENPGICYVVGPRKIRIRPGALDPGHYELVGMWLCYACECSGYTQPGAFCVFAADAAAEYRPHGCACGYDVGAWSSTVLSCARRDVRFNLTIAPDPQTVLPDTCAVLVALQSKEHAEAEWPAISTIPPASWSLVEGGAVEPAEFPCETLLEPVEMRDVDFRWVLQTDPPMALSPQRVVTLHSDVRVWASECVGGVADPPLIRCVDGSVYPLELIAKSPAEWGDPPRTATATLHNPGFLKVWADENKTTLLIDGAGTYQWPLSAGGELDMYVYIEGIASGDDELILDVEYDGFECADSQRIVVAEVVQTAWVELPEMPLGENPGVGGGTRAFPEKLSSVDPGSDRRVIVRSLIAPPIPDVVVRFRSIDVDDPSASAPPLDNESHGEDNRGTPKAGVLSATSATTNASGIAEVYFSPTAQPADNFRVVASCRTEAWISGVWAHPSVQDGRVCYPGTAVALPEGVLVTRMLTAWRRVHLELDSMGPGTDSNTGSKKIDDVWTEDPHASDSRVELENWALTDEDDHRFEDGQLVVSGGGTYQVIDTGNNGGDDELIVANTTGIAGELGRWAVGYDDDAAFVPRKALIDTLNSKYSRAYVEFLEESGASDLDVPFIANLSDDAAAASNAAAPRRDLATQPGYWCVQVLSAYQGPAATDFDPDLVYHVHGSSAEGGESALYAEAPAAGTPDVYDNVCILFLETIRDYSAFSQWGAAWFQGEVVPRGAADIERVSVAHELCHVFGFSAHVDGTLMKEGADDSSLEFSDEQIATVRGSTAIGEP